MKRLFITALTAAMLVGCGDLQSLLKQMHGKMDTGAVVVMGRDLAKGLKDIRGLSGGVAGLAPQLTFTVSGGVGGAPAMSLAPMLGPVETGYTCLGTETSTSKETKTKPESPEEQEVTTYVSWVCKGPGDGPYASAMTAEIKYADGSTGTTSFFEIDNPPNDVLDQDILEGFGRLTVKRYWPAPDTRSQFTLIGEVDPQGNFDTTPNKWRRAQLIVSMRNGSEITAEIVPDAPIVDGDEMTTGTATRRIVHAEGDIKLTTETAEITGKDTGTYTLVNEYKDGTKDTITVTSDGTVVTVDAKGHDGFERTGSLNLSTGEYELVTTFPANLPISTLTEEGTWRKGANEGTYNRTIVFRGGKTTVTNVTAKVTGNSIEATFTHEEDTTDGSLDDRLQGEIKILETPSVTKLSFSISNTAGDKATLEGMQYPDGSATLHYTKDLVATDVNPDEEGDFTFKPDGSATGTVVKKDGVTTVTVQVTIEPDGTVQGDGSAAAN